MIEISWQKTDADADAGCGDATADVAVDGCKSFRRACVCVRAKLEQWIYELQRIVLSGNFS